MKHLVVILSVVISLTHNVLGQQPRKPIKKISPALNQKLLQFSSFTQKPRRLETLLSGGYAQGIANLEVQDQEGKTPLIRATQANNAYTVEKLINANADLNHQDDYGNTALMYATYQKNVPIIKMLIRSGANPTIENKENKSAILIAQESKRTDIIDILNKKKSAPIPEILDDTFFPKEQVLFNTSEIKNHILTLIKHLPAKTQIKIAMYTFTDQEIAQALIESKKNKDFEITVISDHSQLDCNRAVLQRLTQENIPVYIWPPITLKKFAIMHHKFMIITIQEKSIAMVMTGSYNFTKSAAENNKENVIFSKNAEIIQRYNQEFNAVMQSAITHTGGLRAHHSAEKILVSA